MAGQPVNQDMGKRIADEFNTFDSILWGALGQKAANPAKRTEMVLNALSNYRDFMAKTLSVAGTQKIVKPGGMSTTAGKKEGSTMTITEKLQHDIEVTRQRIEALKAESGKSQPAPTAKMTLLEQITALAHDVSALQDGIAEVSQRADVCVQKQAKMMFPMAKSAPRGWDGVFTKGDEHEQLVSQVMKRASQGGHTSPGPGNPFLPALHARPGM